MANENGNSGGLLRWPLLQQHRERHFTQGKAVRDIIMGVSDGLMVPFALAAGLSSASLPSSVVVTAGLAEVAAGAISMGLGGYLAAKRETDNYARELRREEDEINTMPDIGLINYLNYTSSFLGEAAEIEEILSRYGLGPNEYGPVVSSLRKNHPAWLDFMMKFELGLEKPEEGRAVQSAVTIAVSYAVAATLPLLPYMVVAVPWKAMLISFVVTSAALLLFGGLKGKITGDNPVVSALQTTATGLLASLIAYVMARIVQR